jgi:hypothetical protein
MPTFLAPLWLCAIYLSDIAAAALGFVWNGGRVLYFVGYSGCGEALARVFRPVDRMPVAFDRRNRRYRDTLVVCGAFRPACAAPGLDENVVAGQMRADTLQSTARQTRPEDFQAPSNNPPRRAPSTGRQRNGRSGSFASVAVRQPVPVYTDSRREGSVAVSRNGDIRRQGALSSQLVRRRRPLLRCGSRISACGPGTSQREGFEGCRRSTIDDGQWTCSAPKILVY